MTVATLAMSGTLDEARLLFIAVVNDVDKKFDANLTSFVGILSVPDAFLVLRDFRIKFTSVEVPCLAEAKELLELHRKIIFHFHYARMIYIMLCNTILLSIKHKT